MNYTEANVAVQAAPTRIERTPSPLVRVLKNDPGLLLHLLLVLPVIFGGFLLHINVIQWVLVGFVTILYLVASVMRTAALIQINHDRSLTAFHIRRIKSMGNAIVTITAGLSLITYMLVFLPVVIELI
jgi:diacylglycerol kinase